MHLSFGMSRQLAQHIKPYKSKNEMGPAAMSKKAAVFS